MGKLYEETADRIIKYITKNVPGISKLPPERELCSLLGVSRQTLRHALNECEAKNIITRRQGSGIYLSSSYLRSVNRIAIIIPNRDFYIYPSLISELETLFHSCDYSLDIYESQSSVHSLKEYLKFLIDNPVSTLILHIAKNALPMPFDNLLRQLADKGTNIIFLNNPSPNLMDYTYIKQDDFFSAYSIAGRVIAHAKNWCAFLMHDNLSSYDKYYGMISSFNDLDVDFDEKCIKWFSYEEYQNIEKKQSSLIADLIKSTETIPSVYVCDNDLVAYYLVKYLIKENMYNDDITIYSFDGSYILRILDQPVYSYGTDLKTYASRIVNVALNKEKRMKEVITLPSSLHE